MNDQLQPEDGEYAHFYAGYIHRVIGQDIPKRLLSQVDDVKVYYKELGEKGSQGSYAPGKWTGKEVLGHITDTDRIMAFRALSIARGEKASLPGFDQDQYVTMSGFNDIQLVKLLEDFEASRFALASLLNNIPLTALVNLGSANGADVRVRALFYIIVGHTDHHLSILKERY